VTLLPGESVTLHVSGSRGPQWTAAALSTAPVPRSANDLVAG